MAFKGPAKRLRSFAAALLFTATATLGAQAEPMRMVGFGDSLMAGYGLNAGESFTDKLQAALRAKGHEVEIVNAGVSGDTSSGGLARLDWSIPEGTDFVILEFGGNDMLRGISPDIVEKNIDAMLARLKERNIKVLLAGMRAAPNMGPNYVSRFEAIYPRLAKKYGVQLYPFFLSGLVIDGQRAASEYFLPDNIHPSAKGVDRMVEDALPAVENLLGKPGAS
ncbi:MAG: arylesterase [Methylobacterium mesophilicum]|nr:arylesterase [Methylobacterium mesophilicum]